MFTSERWLCRKAKQLDDSLKWVGAQNILNELYLPICVCLLINLEQTQFDSFSNGFNNVFAIIVAALVIIEPVVVCTSLALGLRERNQDKKTPKL